MVQGMAKPSRRRTEVMEVYRKERTTCEEGTVEGEGYEYGSI